MSDLRKLVDEVRDYVLALPMMDLASRDAVEAIAAFVWDRERKAAPPAARSEAEIKAEALHRIRAAVAEDAAAITHTSLGSYRTALLDLLDREINAADFETEELLVIYFIEGSEKP